MAYQTLYRKWRPRTFDEVVGQSHITSTLKNEITTGRTSHAYMFTGTRGTGKTSTAKILSRALNCENPVDGNPCNECAVCKGIFDESVLDVVEMDAASNNGVENIREIIDQVRYSTASSKFKVYIIDEVHMLSTGAFNALLKTLEEPPNHVIFILATTEIHKVPATILSRCQRFDFKNITSHEIADAVGAILEKEGITASKDAVEYIAYLGNGSMRDALSITEQCLAYKNNDISYEDVTRILGTLDDSFLYRGAEHIATGNVKELLLLFTECIASGKNPDSFADGMLKTMRDILYYITVPEACDFPAKKMTLLQNTAKLFTKEKLIRCLDILGSSLRDLKLSSDSQVLVETLFIRMASPQYEADVSSLLDRITTLEKKIASGNFQVMAPANYSAPAAPVPAAQPEASLQPEALQSSIPEPAFAEPQPAPANERVQHTPQDMPQANGDLDAVIKGWDNVKLHLKDNGKLVSFVSLYGVNPRIEGDALILPFESRDSASRYANGSEKADLAAAINAVYGVNPEIKCIFEEKTTEFADASNDIFDNLAKISTNYPENFKID